MDLRKLKTLIDLVQASGVSELEITEEGVVVEKNGRQTIAADHVLVAVGLKPNRALYDQLKEAGVKVIAVGDCGKVGKIYDAIHSGYKAGLKI